MIPKRKNSGRDAKRTNKNESERVPKKRRANERRGKKKCERGASCPFIHEYQHTLEYYHEGGVATENTIKFGGVGQKLGSS
jgi:hypothetical protein